MRSITIQELAEVFREHYTPGMRVVTSGHFSIPYEAISALDAVAEEYRLFLANPQLAGGQLPDRPGVTLEVPFIGPAVRNSAHLRYFPMRLSMVPQLFEEDPPKIVIVQTSAELLGMVSLGLDVIISPAAIEAVKANGGLLVAQRNPQVPYTYGDGEYYLSYFDYVIDVDRELVPVRPQEPSELDHQIARNVRPLFHDGCTLQGGIGPRVDAILGDLTSLKNLCVVSEMGSDWVMKLDQAGALDPAAPIYVTFMMGSKELYEWADRNPRIYMLRTETGNDPAFIAKHPDVRSVNTAIQADLFGQVNASYIKGRFHSGFGGATDYLVGALHSKGGLAIVVLASIHPKAHVSTIVPQLDTPVTSFQPSYIVTEYGAAKLIGNDLETQHQEMIKIAPPEVRRFLAGVIHDTASLG